MFVQSMSVLSALCTMLEERLGYAKGADYLRMDGSVSKGLVKQFRVEGLPRHTLQQSRSAPFSGEEVTLWLSEHMGPGT